MGTLGEDPSGTSASAAVPALDSRTPYSSRLSARSGERKTLTLEFAAFDSLEACFEKHASLINSALQTLIAAAQAAMVPNA